MTNDDAGDGDPEAFADSLAKIKRDGGNLLVTGDVPGSVHRRACGPLLGTTDAPPRRRVVATVGECTDVEDRLPSGASRDRSNLVVVESDHLVRGDAAVDTGEAPTGPGDRRTVPRTTERDLRALGETIEAAIDDLASSAGGVSPAELRVCFDGLAPLFAEHDRGDVVAFCHLLTNRIAAEDGMGHFHAGLADDDPLVAALEPLFDVVVELEIVEGTPHQRWRTGDEDSGWIPL
jgi:hypothetical protein